MFVAVNDNSCDKAGTSVANNILKVINILIGGGENLKMMHVRNDTLFLADFV